MIEVEQLSKAFGAHLAVDGLSFDVPRGSVVGFLGPNGAGKTTTLRILSGFLGPTSGRVRVGGIDVTLDPRRVQRQMGYMPESCAAYPELRVGEYLGFRAQLKLVPAKQVPAAVARATQLAGIADRSHALIAHLSKGYRQRLGLADALVANPPLLVLDEPTSGLDPNQIREVRKLIRELGEQHTVLLSTHILNEVEKSCDRAVVLHQGRCVAQGSIAELRGLRRPTRGTLVFARELPWEERLSEHAELLSSSVHSVHSVHSGQTEWIVRLKAPELGMQPLLEFLGHRGIAPMEARLERPRLEDVFAQLTGATVHGTASDAGLIRDGAGGAAQ
jgi:ABC-2 type transport system ATP-binding protein